MKVVPVVVVLMETFAKMQELKEQQPEQRRGIIYVTFSRAAMGRFKSADIFSVI